MAENHKRYLDIGEQYYVSADGTLYFVEPIIKDKEVIGQSETALANHAPILKEQRVIDNGIEISEELVFNVRRNFKMGADISVTLKEILGPTPTLRFGAACRIFPGVRGAKARYADAMQIQCENAPCSTLYQHTGYAIIDGKRVFLNGEYSVTAEGLIDKYNVAFSGQLSYYGFTADRHKERFDTLLKLLPSSLRNRSFTPGWACRFSHR